MSAMIKTAIRRSIRRLGFDLIRFPIREEVSYPRLLRERERDHRRGPPLDNDRS